MGNLNSLIEEIKDRVEILPLIKKYVDISLFGSNYMGKCPFHNESKPSFCVYPEQGKYHCYGCGESGDAIDFYSAVNSLELQGSVLALCDEYGIDSSSLYKGDFVFSEAKKRKEIFEIQDLAMNYFRGTLEQNPTAKSYLDKRGIAQKTIDVFDIGYSPDGWDGLKLYLEKMGISPEEAFEAGLLSKSNGKFFDKFRGRIMFPIFDVSKRPVGFGGRVMGEGDPKYLNSPQTKVFKKKDNLFGLYQARKNIAETKEVFLVEGYMDTTSMHQAGFKNTCGVLGTAFTLEQAKRISGLAESAVLLFDGDKAGGKASFRTAEILLTTGIKVKVGSLPQGKDIEDVIRENGEEGVSCLVEDSVPGLDYCIKLLENDSPKSRFAWIKDFLSKINDGVIKSHYASLLSEKCNISLTEILHSKRSPSLEKTQNKKKFSDVSLKDREILQAILFYSDFMPYFKKFEGHKVLESDFAKNFVAKIESYGNQEELFNHINKEEYNFLNRYNLGCKDISVSKFFLEDVKIFIKKEFYKKRKSDLQKMIVSAQQNSQLDLIKNYVAEMQRLACY